MGLNSFLLVNPIWSQTLGGSVTMPLLKGLGTAANTATGFPVLLAAALSFSPAAPAAAAVSSLAAGFAVGSVAAAPRWLIWAALMAAAASAGRSRGRLAALSALVGLGWVWSRAASPRLPLVAVATPAAFVGAALTMAVLLHTAEWIIAAERRRLLAVSASRVEELFRRRVRLASTFLVVIGAYGLWQSLQR